MPEFLTDLKRTHDCGALRASDVGKRVVLFGWVAARRDHGGCVFIDLRDRDGITQVVFEPGVNADAHALAGELRGEFCIGVAGKVVERGGNKNPKLATGEIEVKADALDDLLARRDAAVRDRGRQRRRRRPCASSTATSICGARRCRRTSSCVRRSTRRTRRALRRTRFLEIETPFMVKYTPGGARNFLVPSRLNPGQFYALAESPQIFKQLFMVAGFDRYFQIVRCFRDEDLRLDRQPEFTQIDIEMSFVAEEDVQNVIEGLIAALWKDVLGVDLALPFARHDLRRGDGQLRRRQARPALRAAARRPDRAVTAHDGGGVGAVRRPRSRRRGASSRAGGVPAEHAKALSRAEARQARRVRQGVRRQGPGARAHRRGRRVDAERRCKTISDDLRRAINAAAGASDGDLLFLQFGAKKLVNAVLGGLRLHLGEKLGLIPREAGKAAWRFCGSPTSRCSSHRGRRPGGRAPPVHVAARRRRSSARQRSGAVRARAYDLVLNGIEIGGGSIRIHRPEVQARVFNALGLSDEDARAKFGFLLDAFKYGPPPHGGIAAGSIAWRCCCPAPSRCAT